MTKSAAESMSEVQCPVTGEMCPTLLHIQNITTSHLMPDFMPWTRVEADRRAFETLSRQHRSLAEAIGCQGLNADQQCSFNEQMKQEKQEASAKAQLPLHVKLVQTVKKLVGAN